MSLGIDTFLGYAIDDLSHQWTVDKVTLLNNRVRRTKALRSTDRVAMKSVKDARTEFLETRELYPIGDKKLSNRNSVRNPNNVVGRGVHCVMKCDSIRFALHSMNHRQSISDVGIEHGDVQWPSIGSIDTTTENGKSDGTVLLLVPCLTRLVPIETNLIGCEGNMNARRDAFDLARP